MEIFLLAVQSSSCTGCRNIAIKSPGPALPPWPHNKCHENAAISVHHISEEKANLTVTRSNDVAKADGFSFAFLGGISQLATTESQGREMPFLTPFKAYFQVFQLQGKKSLGKNEIYTFVGHRRQGATAKKLILNRHIF